MSAIVKEASRDHRQATRILTTRYQLTNYDCYEPAVELFDERCFDISQVSVYTLIPTEVYFLITVVTLILSTFMKTSVYVFVIYINFCFILSVSE